MIVHQQLAALTGKPSKKKKKAKELDVTKIEVDDPLFTPNATTPLTKKKKTKTSKEAKKAMKVKPAPQPKKAIPSK